MQDSSIGHKPQGKWTFDEEVTNCFGDMLKRSIPEYDRMRESVYKIGRTFVKDGDILDIGCSDGRAMKPFADEFPDNRVTGVEISEPMIEKAKERFAGYKNVIVKKGDLKQGVEPLKTDLTLSVLTIQFTPIEYRQKILNDIYQNTNDGGAFILVEKVLGDNHLINETMVNTYYDLKRQNGYSEEEVQRKKHSLEGVLVPVTAKWNEELLSSAGFKQVDCFWRWMNFSAWIAIK